MHSNRSGSAVWPVVRPKAWPAAPNELSVSSLLEIEACPRRWAMASANYPEVWDRRGYPPRLVIASLAGSVVHLVLKTVTRALARCGCKSLEDLEAVQVMRRLGGYTKVIEDCIQSILQPFAGNPRAVPMLEVALRSLRSRIPDMRTEAQTFLGRINLQAGSTMLAAQPVGKDRPRTALGPGTYPELELRAPRIGWRGTVDLVTVSSGSCEIVDFKTGAPHDAHRFQLRVYALLWSRDAELNPSARPVDRLTLSYRGGELLVDPPTTAELDVLERQLVDRRQAAVKALNESPPQARPSVDNCQYCNVRQHCEEYWHSLEALAAAAPSASPFMDLQISIVARHGVSSWDGVMHQSRGLGSGKSIVLRTPSGSKFQFANGDRIRVLDAYVSASADNENQPVVGTMTGVSEVFLCARL